jgi:hypothetical protein
MSANITFCAYCYEDVPTKLFDTHFTGCREALIRKASSAIGADESIVRLFIERIEDCDDAHEIVPGVWLGSARAARDTDFLRLNGIKAIVNAAREIKLSPYDTDRAGVREVYDLEMQDLDTYDPTAAFEAGVGHITSHLLLKENVLVHCAVGASRSASIIMAYLMKEHGMTLKDAYWAAKSKRHVVSPNLGFTCRLLALEKSIHGKCSVPKAALTLHRTYKFSFDDDKEADAYFASIIGPDFA